MQPEPALDLPFCDLCNASVPLLDLERGAAVRVHGKLVGACCLAVLRPGSADGAAREGRPGDSRFLPLGVALLAAVAAATIFLDSRLTTLDERYGREIEAMRDASKQQVEALDHVSKALDGAARRADIDGIAERFAGLDERDGKFAEQWQQQAAAQQKELQALAGRLQDVAQRRAPDHGPVLDEIRRQIQALSAQVADAKAAPRAADAPAMPASPARPEGAPTVPDGLPAALVHAVQKLKDEDAAARFVAVDELLHSRNPAVVAHVLPMAKDADVFVRRLTVEGLKEFKQAAVVEALLVALADPEDIVRETAWRSLKDLTGQKLPFEARAARDVRAKAQKAWQDWWEQHRAEFGS